jgi:hypothetical protein
MATTLTDQFEALLGAQKTFFEALGFEQTDLVIDLRDVAWNGDHGVTWWRDKEGRMQEVRGREFVQREGLAFAQGKSRDVPWAWFVFSLEREDASLEW